MRATLHLVLLAGLLQAGEPQADTRRLDLHGDELPLGARARMGTVRWRHDGWVQAIALSPDGKLLASGGADNAIRLWEVSTGKKTRELVTGSAVESLTFSPDGKALATGCFDKTVLLWDVSTGDLIRKLVGHTGEVACVAFSPDGKILASTGLPNMHGEKIRFWEVSTGKEINKLDVGSGKTGARAVAFSPDGKILATGGYDFIRFWELATGMMITEIPLGFVNVRSLIFSPDGKTIATGQGAYT